MTDKMTIDQLKEKLEGLMDGTLAYPDNDYEDGICSALNTIETNRAALEAGMKGTLRFVIEKIERGDHLIPTYRARTDSTTTYFKSCNVYFDPDEAKEEAEHFCDEFNITAEFNDERSR